LVTGQFGGDVVSLDPSDGSTTPFASGFSFATSIDVNAFTGRVELVSSTFIGEDEDFRLHRLTPVARLVAEKEPIKGGKLARECLTETYGVELVATKPGKPAKKAICVDGDSCDADGAVNDVCLFPVGFCVKVEDPNLPECAPSGLATFELKTSKPESPSLVAAAAALQAAAPLASSTCAFSDGVAVPLKITGSGTKRRGKGVVKVKATSDDAKPIKDADAVKLVCEPS